jgi:hypothetical protein
MSRGFYVELRRCPGGALGALFTVHGSGWQPDSSTTELQLLGVLEVDIASARCSFVPESAVVESGDSAGFRLVEIGNGRGGGTMLEHAIVRLAWRTMQEPGLDWYNFLV